MGLRVHGLEVEGCKRFRNLALLASWMPLWLSCFDVTKRAIGKLCRRIGFSAQACRGGLGVNCFSWLRHLWFRQLGLRHFGLNFVEWSDVLLGVVIISILRPIIYGPYSRRVSSSKHRGRPLLRCRLGSTCVAQSLELTVQRNSNFYRIEFRVSSSGFRSAVQCGVRFYCTMLCRTHVEHMAVVMVGLVTVVDGIRAGVRCCLYLQFTNTAVRSRDRHAKS